MNRGNDIESIVQDICNLRFFADFTYRSPKYKKADGQEKEAADILVILDSKILVIQIKTKKVKMEGGVLGEIEMRRITSTMEKGIRQFRALAEALQRPDFNILVNSRGVKIEFKRESIKDIILLLIMDPFCEDGDLGQLFRPSRTCMVEEGAEIPLHIFSLHQFHVLASLADTLPDFLQFLEVSWALHSLKLLKPSIDPVDEWKMQTFEKQIISSAVKSMEPLGILGREEEHSNLLMLLEEKEKNSYLIDILIENLSNGVGKNWKIDSRLDKIANLVEPPNSQAANNALIPLLARLKRSYRVEVIKCYLEKVARCRTMPKESSFGGVIFEGFEEGYLLFASRRDFEVVHMDIMAIGWEFCRKNKLKKSICIFGCKVDECDQPLGVLMIEFENDLNLLNFGDFDPQLFDAQEYRTI
ncbi:hypothetical protein JIN84_01060 [Luteolibacter yonseiensis]|uniref:NERD domain-containing protein n=1 Tax=Luteolibacter yonseiensis TaxID=1144680 RepID=A0A934R115_9BACT|nr:hypothetical protein [Luteolibacter yonseiensis]MBK1814198.1 hypothetical protein [Luteolibacter yonseiensis]